jgi:hypothetical protein
MTRRFSKIVALAAALSACATEPTQLVVVVETNLDVPSEIDTVEVVVTGPSAVSTSTSEALVGPDDPPFPLTLTVLPAGSALGPVSITARGLLGDSEAIRAEVRTELVDGKSKMVRLFLLRGCIDRPCVGMTCGEAGCTPIAVAGETLPAWTGEPPPFDGDEPCAANPWDQDGDGQGAEACGGSDCDDLEPRSHSGNVEDCDGIDNDCDGARDEDCGCAPDGVVEACPTMCGSTGSRTCISGTFSPCLADEVCSGSDTDCDGVTDEGFAYEAGPIRAITSNGGDSNEPHLVFVDGRFHVVWVEDDDSVYYLSLSPDGDPGAMTPIEVTRDGREPRIAWTGTRFGLTFYDTATVSCGFKCTRTEHRVRFTTFDVTGALASPVVQLADRADVPVTPRIVWTGAELGIAHNDDDLYMHVADEMGNVVGGRTSVDPRGGGLDMLHTGASYALLFSEDREVYFNRGSTGSFLNPSVVVHSGGSRIENVTFVQTDLGFFAAWARESGREVETAVIDEEGALIGTPIVHTTPSLRVRDEVRPEVAAAPGQVFLVFRAEDIGGDDDLYFARYAADGRELQPLTRVVAPANQFSASLAWATDHLGIAYIDDSGADDQLHFMTLSCP